MKFLGVATALFLASPCANAQELWNGSEVGDKTEDLLKKFAGEAELFNEPKEFNDGRWSYVGIDNKLIGGDPFDVRFVSDESGLVFVQLVRTKEDTGEGVYPFQFDDYVDLLSLKYGDPVRQMPVEMSDRGFLQMLENEFRTEDLRITISCIFCLKRDARISINYEATAKTAADGF